MKTPVFFIATVLLSLALSIASTQADTGCANSDPHGPPGPPCDECPKPPNCAEGSSNVFKPYSGNAHREIRDLRMFAGFRGSVLEWKRYSNTRFATGQTLFGTSSNFRHGYQWEMVDSGFDSLGRALLTVYHPNGYIHRFTQVSPTQWNPTAAVPHVIRQDGDNFTLEDASGRRFLFARVLDSEGGQFYQLQSIVDANQNSVQLSYDEGGRLAQVADAAGRSLSVSYQALPIVKVDFQALATPIAATPPSGWNEITVAAPQAFRYVRYRGADNTRSVVAEIELYDAAGNKLSGTPFGQGAATGTYSYTKAFDGNGSTKYSSGLLTGGFTGLDLGPNAAAVARIRFLPGSNGDESRMKEGVFEGANSLPQDIAVISQVQASDGRTVTYHYQATADPILGSLYQTLTTVNYGGGAQAVYTYAQVLPGTRPLMTSAKDVRYEGKVSHVVYEYGTSGSQVLGLITKERNGRTGSELAALSFLTAHQPRVTYPSGAAHDLVFDGQKSGLLLKKTDSLGRRTTFTYDQDGYGYLASVTDPRGGITRYVNTPKGNVLEERKADGTTRKWTRDSLDQVLTETDENGRTTTYTRDASHRVTRIDYPDTSFETFAYNAQGQVTSHTLRNGGTETTVYNARGLKTSSTNALNQTTYFAYDTAERLASQTDPRGNTTGFQYDNESNVTRITYPGGATRLFTYDAQGNKLTETNELGKIWTYTYDEFNRLLTATDPLNRTTTYSYAQGAAVCGSCHADAKPTQITYPSGKVVKTAYDLEGQKTSEIVGFGSAEAATTAYGYDLNGNVTALTDPKGQVWATEYDAMGRRTSSTDPLGNRTEWTYDAAGNVLTEKRADAGITRHAYDVMNRLTRTTDPKGQITDFSYGGTGYNNGTRGDNLTRLKDARGNTYSFWYDLLDRKTAMDYPINGAERWTYDAAGNMATYRTRSAKVMTCTYDARNRQTLCNWNDSTPDMTKSYDAAGRLLTLNTSVSQLSYTYDDANQLLSETSAVATGGAPKTVSYTYDADGNKASVTYPSGSVVSYAYTARQQMASIIADAPPPMAAYTYDLNGNRTLKTLENGTSAIYSYDNASRLLGIDHRKGAASLLQLGYTYNAVSNRTTKSTTLASTAPVTETYGYDAVDQVTSVDYGTGRTTAFNYDAVGNRTTVADSAGLVPASYTVDVGNRYTSIDGRVVGNDYNGNLSSATYTAGGPAWTYTYDSHNRLLSASATGTTVTFAYDGRNRCVRRTVNGAATFFIYDEWRLIEERGANDAELRRYIHGAQVDEIIAMIDTSASHFYHHDALGSTVALTNANGDIEERYSYGVYGAPSFYDANGQSLAATALGSRFLFTGREWIGEAGLYDYRNRAYSAHVGRFLQVDPIRFAAHDVNIYRYVNNAPAAHTDSFGLAPDFSDGSCEGPRKGQIERGMSRYCGEFNDRNSAGRRCCDTDSNPPDDRILARVEKLCSDNNTKFSCVAQNDTRCKSPLNGGITGGVTPVGVNHITICQAGFEEPWRNVGCLILHELVHAAGRKDETLANKVHGCLTGCPRGAPH